MELQNETAIETAEDFRLRPVDLEAELSKEEEFCLFCPDCDVPLIDLDIMFSECPQYGFVIGG